MNKQKKIAPIGSPMYQKIDSLVANNAIVNEATEIVRNMFLSFMRELSTKSRRDTSRFLSKSQQILP